MKRWLISGFGILDDSFPVSKISMTHFRFLNFCDVKNGFGFFWNGKTVFQFFETAKTVFQVFKRIKVVFVGCWWVISGFGILDDSFPICLRRQDRVLVFLKRQKRFLDFLKRDEFSIYFLYLSIRVFLFAKKMKKKAEKAIQYQNFI